MRGYAIQGERGFDDRERERGWGVEGEKTREIYLRNSEDAHAATGTSSLLFIECHTSRASLDHA